MRLQTKIILLIGTILVAMGLTMSLYVVERHRDVALESMTRKALSVGRILATSAAPAIDFYELDPGVLQTVLRYARQDSDIAYIRVFDSSGHELPGLFASRGSRYQFGRQDRPQQQLVDGQLHLLFPVRAKPKPTDPSEPGPEVHRDGKGEMVGAIQIGYSLAFVERELRRYRIATGLMVGLLTLLGILVTLLGVRIMVVRPVQELERGVRALGQGNTAGVRAVVRSRDEIGTLGRAFNQMVVDLHDRTELSNNTLSAMLDPVLVLDMDGTVRKVNPAACQLLGYEEAGLLGRPLSAVLAPTEGDSGALQSQLLSQLAAEQSVRNLMVGLMPRTGEPINISVNGAAIHDIELKAGAIVLVARDLRETHRRIAAEATAAAQQQKARELEQAYDELKDAHTRLRDAQAQLIEVSRMAGQADVANSILHNVGNVLNSVNISSEMLRRELRAFRLESLRQGIAVLQTDPETDISRWRESAKGSKTLRLLTLIAEDLGKKQSKMDEEVDVLADNVNHIKIIISTQQAFAKVAGVYEQLRIEEVVLNAVDIYRKSLEHSGIQLDLELGETEPFAMDRHKVMQILLNLLSNAKQALVSSHRVDKRLSIETRTIAPGRVRVTVADNGVGIASANLVQVFKQGFTTKKDGHGFGLHASANAAREMNGSLTCESAGEGAGATFVLEVEARALGGPLAAAPENVA